MENVDILLVFANSKRQKVINKIDFSSKKLRLGNNLKIPATNYDQKEKASRLLKLIKSHD